MTFVWNSYRELVFFDIESQICNLKMSYAKWQKSLMPSEEKEEEKRSEEMTS